jgi:hypothetical protein
MLWSWKVSAEKEVGAVGIDWTDDTIVELKEWLLVPSKLDFDVFLRDGIGVWFSISLYLLSEHIEVNAPIYGFYFLIKYLGFTFS